jgi:hypothetical protein
MQPPRAANHRTLKVGEDSAAYLVDPGSVSSPTKISPGNLAHVRPYLVSGNSFFVFPVGPEGFRRSGTAGISIHKYLNQVAVDVHVFHREEGRIELTGTFPGLTAQPNMVDCIEILRSKPPKPGLILHVPGVFDMEQIVAAENWDFTHSPDDRTHSIDYSITFVRSGEKKRQVDPLGAPPTPNPTISGPPKGKPERFFTVVEGARTLKQIAFTVYHDANKWKQIVALNQGQLAIFQRSNYLNDLSSLPTYQLPTYRWPIGTRFRY